MTRLSIEPVFLTRTAPRMPDWHRVLLVVVMLVSGTVTVPQAIGFGETSGLGVWTTMIAAAVWALWMVRPYYPREHSRVLLPLILFSIYATLSLWWGGVSVKALQNLSVSVGFTGFVLLTARICEKSPHFAFTLHRALDVASVFAAIGYTLTFLVFGEASDAFFNGRMLFAARPFALFAAVAVARQVSRWQGGDIKGFFIAVWLVTLVFLSQSRLGMVACLILFPLAMCCRGDFKSIARAGVMMLVAGGVLAASICLSTSMYQRFFGYDANINVGGVAINSSGRAEMWQKLIDDLRGGAVYFGRGAGGAGRLIDQYFPGLGHPHNDFLRFWYDFGALGLGLWVIFLIGVIWHMIGKVRQCAGDGARAIPDHADLPLHLTPLLALLAVIASMFTDNSVSYIFVMAPLGMLIGVSLSRKAYKPRTAKPAEPKVDRPRERVIVLDLPSWDLDAPPADVRTEHA